VTVTAAELALAVDGVIVGDAGAVASSFAIDSRVLEAGACFVALRGERDGHDFVGDAFAHGARIALVARAVDHPPGTALIVVEDPLAALARAAANARLGWRDAVTVVGITGSAGKTSTKDLTAAALAGARRVHASPGSFNNEAGLPLTLLHAPPGTDVVVAEMGARFRGNIAELCEVARPTVGVVTHIGLAHAEHLGGPEGILATKAELVEALPATGLAVLNADDPATPALAARTVARVVTVGSASAADVVIHDLALDAELRPRFGLVSPWGQVEIALAVRGAHQAHNAAMAATVALALDVAPDTVARGLAGAAPAEWRMELVTSPTGVVVLNDAYNASPTSMQAALRALGDLPAAGRRVAVLGDMLELGSHADAEHAGLAQLALDAGVDVLIAVGPGAAAAATRAADAGLEVHTVDDRDQARAVVDRHVQPGDAVLVKASRAIGLETVGDALARGEIAG
jgi:UDP-N-acetylmuramoyl-tripeptide--D-alanyl-D-alanine ligase